MNTLAIARLTLKEAARKRILLLAVVGGLLFLLIYGIGMAMVLDAAKPTVRPGSGSMNVPIFESLMLIMGFIVVNFLAGMSAIFLSVSAISGEIDSGTMQPVLARPVARWQLILGKWLGYALVLSLYIGILSGGLIVISQVITGVGAREPLPTMGMMIWLTLLLLSMSILGGTFFSSMANGVTLFLLYGLAWLAGMVEAIGMMVRNDTMLYVGIMVSLLVPSDALWRGATYYLQPTWMLLAQGTTPSNTVPFLSSAPPSTGMLIWAGAYTAVCLGLAMTIFTRRDL